MTSEGSSQRVRNPPRQRGPFHATGSRISMQEAQLTAEGCRLENQLGPLFGDFLGRREMSHE